MSGIRSRTEGAKSPGGPISLSRRRVILETEGAVYLSESQIFGVEFPCVMFSSELGDDKDDPSNTLNEFQMDEASWQEFGSPKTITLTIEPGDRLNG